MEGPICTGKKHVVVTYSDKVQLLSSIYLREAFIDDLGDTYHSLRIGGRHIDSLR